MTSAVVGLKLLDEVGARGFESGKENDCFRTFRCQNEFYLR